MRSKSVVLAVVSAVIAGLTLVVPGSSAQAAPN